jgi:hypothetical protein
MTKSPGARARTFPVPTPEITAICSCTKPSRSSLMPECRIGSSPCCAGFLRCSVHLFYGAKDFSCTPTPRTCKSRTQFAHPLPGSRNRVPGLDSRLPSVKVEFLDCVARSPACKSIPWVAKSTFRACKSRILGEDAPPPESGVGHQETARLGWFRSSDPESSLHWNHPPSHRKERDDSALLTRWCCKTQGMFWTRVGHVATTIAA